MILDAFGFGKGANPFESMWNVALGNLIIALCGAVPGYWVTVFTVEKRKCFNGDESLLNPWEKKPTLCASSNYSWTETYPVFRIRCADYIVWRNGCLF